MSKGDSYGKEARLKAPFPWFGGKSMIAPVVWQALGNPGNYVEPFAGSLAVLLGRPHKPKIETCNDKDGFIVNAWRAIKHDPDQVAYWADQPVFECDLHARHLWLVERKDMLPLLLMGDPDYYDAKIAGWWIWGISSWIGGEFCSGKGPWHSVDGVFTNLDSDAGGGVNRRRPHLGNAGKGVNRRRPHLGGVGNGLGVNAVGMHQSSSGLVGFMHRLANRLRYVRVCCGDWMRVAGPAVTVTHGLTGIFLDPPYSQDIREASVYNTDEVGISQAVREWAIENGDNPLLRIALCGYEGEHTMPDTWRCVTWKANGGMGNQSNGRGRENATRERIWLSPHCLKDDQMTLF